ncbi:ester cyclase [Aureimonas sp. OT7]|uniref:nuclear transport factor 2 family protein n=1 Tax=Aureimonas sp. OT7 TaxID=2816454 RepID=UPI00177E6D11|nr:ester cyclase [Aureimonas sp. OT7]QOG07385.1 ester cyclase [Aureimonas sp. OT7]
MSPEDHIRRLYAAVNAGDLATIEAFGCEASEWLDVPFDYLATGTRAIVDPWAAWLGYFPDTDCQPYSIVGMGDTVVAQGITVATHRGAFDSPAGRLEPTGRRIETRFCDVYRLQGDKIIRADSYFDFYTLLGQLAPELLPKVAA